MAEGQGLVEWAYGEFTEKMGDLEIIYLLSKNSNLMPDDPILQQHFEEYELTIEPEIFSTIQDCRTGRQTPTWTLADFEFTKDNKKDPAKDRFVCWRLLRTMFILKKGSHVLKRRWRVMSWVVI